MEKNLSEIILNAWNEMRNNFHIYLPLMLIFTYIPTVIFETSLSGLEEKLNMGQILSTSETLTITFLSIILILLYFMGVVSIIYTIIKTPKPKFTEAIKQGSKYYLKYLLLALLLFTFIFLIPLIILMIIGAIGLLIIFFISTIYYSLASVILLSALFILLLISAIIIHTYLMFSPYILIKENTNVIDALKKSKNLVKGKWWKLFSYLLVPTVILTIIITGIMFLIENITNNNLLNTMMNNALNIIGSIFIIIFTYQLYEAITNKEKTQTRKKIKK